MIDEHGVVSFGFLHTRFEGDQKPLSLALLECQKNFPEMPKKGVGATGQGGSRTYKYAKLPDILSLITPILNRNGILLTHSMLPCPEDGNLYLVTELEHVESQGKRATAYPVCSLKGQSQQEIGKSLTYARRYTISALLSLATEEDTDAQGNGTKTAGGQAPKAPYKPVEKPPARKAQEPVPEPATVASEPVDPVPSTAATESDESKGRRLWRKALSTDLTLDGINAATKEAGSIGPEQIHTPIKTALEVRNLILRTVDEKEIAAARELVTKIPAKLLASATSKDGPTVKSFLEGLISAKEKEVKGTK